MRTIVAETRIAAPPEQVWSLLARTESLRTLSGPELDLAPVETWPEVLTQGAVIQFNVRTFGLPMLWACEFVKVEPPHKWVLQQRTSPFRFWQVAETLYPVGNDTLLEDCICYAVNGGSIGMAIAAPLLIPKLERIIDHRHRAVHRLIEPAAAAAAAAR